VLPSERVAARAGLIALTTDVRNVPSWIRASRLSRLMAGKESRATRTLGPRRRCSPANEQQEGKQQSMKKAIKPTVAKKPAAKRQTQKQPTIKLAKPKKAQAGDRLAEVVA